MTTPAPRESLTPRRDLDQFASLMRESLTPRRTSTTLPLSRRTSHANSPFTTPRTFARRNRRRTSVYNPGERRKSFRAQRETPIDILRHLSKALAPSTKPVSPSPPSPNTQSEKSASSSSSSSASASSSPSRHTFRLEDFDDSPDQAPPRFSLTDQEMGVNEHHSSSDMQPPRLSLSLVDNNNNNNNNRDNGQQESRRRADKHPTPGPSTSAAAKDAAGTSSPESRPRPSMGSPGDTTTRSIEMPRRERPFLERSAFPRISVGSFLEDVTTVEDDDEGAGEGKSVLPDVDAFDDDDAMPAELENGDSTENLRKFQLDFDFPTPDKAAEAPGDDADIDMGLPEPDAGPPSSDSLGAGGDGIELADPMSDNVADAAQDDDAAPQAAPEVPQLPLSRGGKRPLSISRHGMPVPRLPSGTVKKLAGRVAKGKTKGKARIPGDALAVMEQATEWFFEQASDDLAAYAKHAGRKTVDESDVIALLRRQRHVGRNTSVFALAQKYLPKELLQEVRIPRW